MSKYESALHAAYLNLALADFPPALKQKISNILFDSKDMLPDDDFEQLEFRILKWREEFDFLLTDSNLLNFISKNIVVLIQSEHSKTVFYTDLLGLEKAAYEIMKGGNELVKLLDYEFCKDIHFTRLFFNRCAWFLIYDINYNVLRDIVYFYANWITFIGDGLSCSDAILLMKDYVFFLRRLNGRVVGNHPIILIENYYADLKEKSVLLGDNSNALIDFSEIYYFYFKCFMMNCFYKEAENILNMVGNFDANLALDVLMKACGSVYENPVRSEKNGYYRESIRKKIIEHIYRLLEEKHVGIINSEVNFLIKSTLERDVPSLLYYISTLNEKIKKSGLDDALVLQKRAKECFLAIKFLVAMNKYPQALKLMKMVKSGTGALARKKLLFQILSYQNKNQELDDLIRQDSRMLNFYKCKQIYAMNLKSRGDFSLAEYFMRNSAVDIEDRIRISSIYKSADRIKFLGETSDLINSVAQPQLREVKGVVFLATLSCVNSLAILAPCLTEIKKLGYAVVHLNFGTILNHNTGINDVDRLGSSIPAVVGDGDIKLDWSVNFAEREFLCEGVNYYQGVYEHLSGRFRRFHIDTNDPSVKRIIDSQIRCADFILRICKDIDSNIVAKGLPVVLLAGNSHVSPYSIFRDYCLAQDNPRLRFVASNVAYENYYSNLGGKFSGSMAVVDMTLHRTCRAPFLPIKERFDKWYSENINDPHIEYRVSKLLSANRVARENQEASPNLARVVSAKQQGTKIICCFGKILCDMAVPYDGGPAHTDIADWLNHTIDVVKDNPDILLLIKPHPHELRTEIALDLVEFLRDVVPAILPDNVIFLDHKEFNVAEMANLLDLAVLWNGTSSLELAIMGVPVMMCGYFGRHDYPVELIYPESRSQYADYLCSLHYTKPSSEVGRRAAALLHYMGTTDVALPNRYSRRPITNDSVGVPVWDKIALQTYLSVGDPVIELAADRVIEGVRRFLG